MNEINTELFSISEQVMDSLSCGRAVVALESSVVSAANILFNSKDGTS